MQEQRGDREGEQAGRWRGGVCVYMSVSVCAGGGGGAGLHGQSEMKGKKVGLG